MMSFIRSRKRTTKWNLFFHYCSIALAVVSGIVLVPLYLRFIPLDLYGAWLATGNILAWITIVDPGLSTVLQQRASVAYGKGDTDELNALLISGLLLSGVVSLLVLITGYVSSTFLASWLNLGSYANTFLIEQAFLLATVGSALMFFSFGLTSFNQGLQSSVGIGLVFVVTMIVSLLLTVVLLLKGFGLLAIPIGSIARGVGLILGNTAYLIWRHIDEKMLSYRFSLKGIVTLVKLISFTFFGKMAGVLASNMDAFVLTRYLGPEIAPVFVLTRKAPDLSRMFMERPAVAFMPAISHLIGSGEMKRAKKILLRLMRIIVWLLGVTTAGFLVFNKTFVSLWVGSDLFAGNTVNLLIALALLFTVITNALSSLCFSLGNIKGNSIATLVQGLVSVPLMIIGAKYWGMLGVAIAPLLAMLTVSAWYYPLTFTRQLKLGRMDVLAFTREFGNAFLAATITVGILFWITPKTWLVFVSSVVLFCLLYLLVLSLLSRTFRDEIIRLLKSRKQKEHKKKKHLRRYDYDQNRRV